MVTKIVKKIVTVQNFYYPEPSLLVWTKIKFTARGQICPSRLWLLKYDSLGHKKNTLLWFREGVSACICIFCILIRPASLITTRREFISSNAPNNALVNHGGQQGAPKCHWHDLFFSLSAPEIHFILYIYYYYMYLACGVLRGRKEVRWSKDGRRVQIIRFRSSSRG